ncbi:MULTISPECIES: hypothetical protein [unclassified Lysobacter]|uniref:hypothetical protein n=1 Tax=unclassified Lysobacter TaxID=2635362 RepID=UPI001C231790|nr:hypothetical protein [Lysobacter sp. MMG2]MBU8976739.1 hypothetical protein [Lysobacter sp. MMG2]
MANRERALAPSGRGIGVSRKALSFGYFSLGKQRKVTRAAQPIGSFVVAPSLRSLRKPNQNGFQLSLE